MLVVLTYHSIDGEPSILSTSPRAFAEHMRILQDTGAEPVPLERAVAALGAGRPVPERAVAITFDDGLESVYRHAAPVLARLGYPATVFLVTAFVGRDSSWPGQPPWAAGRPLLGWREARELSAAGLGFGAHTMTHPDLTRVSPAEAAEEIRGAKDAIQQELGRPVESFAYPYGAYDRTVRELAMAHFTVACSTRLGSATARSDAWALPRVDAYYVQSPRLFARLFSPEMRAYLLARRTLGTVRGALAGHRSPRARMRPRW